MSKVTRYSSWLCLEPLEPRLLLDAGAHGLFAGEVFAADSELLRTADFNRDGVPDLIGVASQLSILLGRGDGTFSQRTRIDVGNPLCGVAIADFDGDEASDIVVGGADCMSVQVVQNNGDGSFQAPVSYSIDGELLAIAAIEATGDEFVDLVMATKKTQSFPSPPLYRVSVLAGHGNGSFGPLSHIELEEPVARELAAGDLNGDETADVVLATSSGNQLLVLPGLIEGGFGAPIRTTTRPGIRAIELADIDNDTRLDVVTAEDTNETTGIVVYSGNGDGTFAEPGFYAAGLGTQFVSVGDVNHDGAADVIAKSPVDFVVFLNNGDGSFAARREYAAVSVTGGLAVDDFTGDGAVDVAVGGSLVTILPGNGDGTFQGFERLATGYSFIGVGTLAEGDLNGDGRVDLVRTNGPSWDERSISVLFNSGAGQFETQTFYTLPRPPESAAVADLDGDGDRDLIVEGTGEIYLLSNNGDGTFADPVTLAGLRSDTPIRTIELNGDGVPDLVTSDQSSSTIFAHFGLGDGTFSAATPLITEPTSYYDLADFDGNGAFDFVVPHRLGFAVYLNAGDGTFRQLEHEPVEEVIQRMSAGDVNGDGKPDLVEVSEQHVSVWLGEGDGRFVLASRYEDDSESTVYENLNVADLNNDGFDDVLMGDGVVLLGRSDGSLVRQSKFKVSGLSLVADFDADGILDIAATVQGGVQILLGNGDGTFYTRSGSLGEPSMAGTISEVVLADLNRDGQLDAVSANGGSAADFTISVRLGRDDGAFEPDVEHYVGSYATSLAIGNINGDRDLDLITASRSMRTVSVLLGRGDGGFGDYTEYDVMGEPVDVALDDVDGDGIEDLVTAIQRKVGYDAISVRYGYGDGVFGPERIFRTGDQPTALAIADLDGDTILDVVTSNGLDANLSLLFGDGMGGFASPVAVAAGPQSDSVAVGYLNDDGALDLVASSPGHGHFVVLNNGDGTFGSPTQYGERVWTEADLKLSDLNGDDLTDIVVAEWQTISVLLGRGDGSFTEQAYYRSMPGRADNVVSFDSLAVGDLDGDDLPDVVTADASSRHHTLNVFRQSQPWEIRHAPGLSAAAPVSSLTVHFPSPMDITSFKIEEDVVSFDGPSGPIDVSDYSWLNRSTLEVVFDAQAVAGSYELVLGPDILDSLGNAMDLDGDGGGEPGDDQYLARFEIAAPQITAYQHTGGITGPVDALRLTFAAPMDASSFSLADDVVSFTGPHGAIVASGYTWISSRALEITFSSQSAVGTYSLTVGPEITDAGGNSLTGTYSADFVIRGPRITAHVPVGATSGPVSAVQVSFDRAMEEDSFDLVEDIVSFTGPTGAVTSTGHQWVDDETLEITFDPQAAGGVYELILGPNILDIGGNAMDLDRDLLAGETVDDRYSAHFLITSVVADDIQTDTTWSGLVIVEGQVKIRSTATVAVQPGTVIKFRDDTGSIPYEGRLTVDGILDVQGTAAAPVIFTSIHDDSAGGDTNLNGESTFAVPGDWTYVSFNGAVASTISHAEFRYGTGGSTGSPHVLDIINSSPLLTDVLVTKASGSAIRIRGESQPVISQLRVVDIGGTGVLVDGVRPEHTVTLSDITVDGARGGILIAAGTYFGAPGGTVNLQGAHLQRIVGGWPLEVDDDHNLPNIDFASLEIDEQTCTRGRAINAVAPEADFTLDPSFVWVMSGTVEPGTTLTIPAGTIVKQRGSGLTVQGTLDALGTAENPVVFTAHDDDSVGGDTNGDGRATDPRDSYDLTRLNFIGPSASNSRLEYVEVRYSGSYVPSFPSGGHELAAVSIEEASPTLSHVTIRDAQFWAIEIGTDAAPTITDLTVDRIYVDNEGLGGNAIYVREDAGEFTVDGATLSRVDNWPIYLENPNHWGRLDNVDIEANNSARGAAGYVAGGTLTTDAAPSPDVTWQVAGVTVAGGSRLTLAPGTIIKGGQFDVQGTLAVQGTAAQPVVLTSLDDDSIGADTQASGNVAAPGSGSRIRIHTNGQATLDNIQSRFAPSAVEVLGGQAELTDCEISDASGVPVYVNAGQVTLTRCLIHATGTAVEGRGGASLDLVNNQLLGRDASEPVVSALDSGTTLTLLSNTIVGGGFGVNVEEAAYLDSAVNNLIAFNTTAGIAMIHGGSFGEDFRFNNVYNPGAVAKYINMPDFTGIASNISADPLFVDRASGDLRLGPGSPSVDAADGDAAPAFDRNGWPRFDDLGTPNTGSGSPPYADMGSEERIADSESSIDLIVVPDSVSGPDSAVTEETVTLQWTIRNEGTEPAVGPWHDRVFLSPTDDALGSGFLVGEVLVGEGVTLLSGEQLPVAAEITIPAAPFGDYYWQVQTNTRLEVFEGQNRHNNLHTSTARVAVQMPQLQIGVPRPGTFTKNGEARYYAVLIGAGDELLIKLDDADDEGYNELYVRMGDLPTRSEYDFAGGQNLSADQQVQIVSPIATYAYVLVHARDVAAAPSDFTLTASIPGFAVHTLTPSAGGNVGNVTVSIQGEGLPEDGFVYLSRGEAESEERVWGWPLRRETGATLYATFDLREVSEGIYDLYVIRPDRTVTVKQDAFEVLAGNGPDLKTTIIAPAGLRRGDPFTVSVVWENVGDVDLVPPELLVEMPSGVPLYYPLPFDQQVTNKPFMAYSSTGPAGVLQPGDREMATFWSVAKVPQATYDIGLLAATYEWYENPLKETEIDWAAHIEERNSPIFDFEGDWQFIWQLFASEVGQTVNDFLTKLASQVTANGVEPGQLPLVNDLLDEFFVHAMGRGSGGLFDTEPPHVSVYVPHFGSEGLEAVDVVFSESIDAASFTVAAVMLSDPNQQPIPVTSINRLADRIYQVEFPPQSSSGQYILQVLPTVTDQVGYGLDQDFSGVGGQLESDAFEAVVEVGQSADPAGLLQTSTVIPSRPLQVREAKLEHEYDRQSGLLYFDVYFNKPVLKGKESGTFTFDASDVELLGPLSITSQVQIIVEPKTNQHFRIQFREPGGAKSSFDTPEQYQLKIGGDILAQDGSSFYQSPLLKQENWIESFRIVDEIGPRVLEYYVLDDSPFQVVYPPVKEVTFRFNEALKDFPAGEVQVYRQLEGGAWDTTKVAAQVIGDPICIDPAESGRDPRFDERQLWKVAFEELTEPGIYGVFVGPHIEDYYGWRWDFVSPGAKNQMDQDRDGVQGTSSDIFVGQFEIVPPTGEVSGVVQYADGWLREFFGDNMHASVQLWEKDGAVIDLGTHAGDEADDFISDWNMLTNGITVSAEDQTREQLRRGILREDGAFRFTRTHDDQPIEFVDLDDDDGDELPEYYLVVVPKNEYGFVLQADTLQATDPNSPIYMPVYPDGVPEGQTQRWARLVFSIDTAKLMHPDPDAPDTVDFGTVVVEYPQPPAAPLPFDYDLTRAFGLAEWVRYGGQWLYDQLDGRLHDRVAVLYPWPGIVNSIDFAEGERYIRADEGGTDPFETLRAYAHALDFQQKGEAPTGVVGDFGIILPSANENTAWYEAWANLFAGLALDALPPSMRYEVYDTVSRASGNRTANPEWDTNDFWMAWDAFGYTADNSHLATDDRINIKVLDSHFDAAGAINRIANTGETVSGAVQSILWDIADGRSGGSDDDWVGPDLAGIFQGLSAAAYPGYPRNRFVDAIYIDHGIPITDDSGDEDSSSNQTDYIARGVGPTLWPHLKDPTALTGKIMAETQPGAADWWNWKLKTGVFRQILDDDINVRLEYDPYYGDLDLKVIIDEERGFFDTTPFDQLEHYEYSEIGTDDGSIQIRAHEMDFDKTYTVHVGVAGRGAFHGQHEKYPDTGVFAGDMHPSYNLYIFPAQSSPSYHYYIQQLTVPVYTAYDPNEKVGALGAGDGHYLANNGPLSYTVYFENDPDLATAPARKVVITDQLDPDLDWNTFEFQQIQFGEVVLAVPDGRLHYETDVTVSYDDYPVHVTADFDPASGLLTWEMVSYDAMTGAAPRDPLAGFLPVNNDLRQGEGLVTFTVEPKSDLATGTEIRNKASIVFDVNEPIITDETMNTIDAGAPTSSVAALPAITYATEFLVAWAGEDDAGGSGLASYDVYVSDDAGPYQRWLDDAPDTSASFSGSNGHTYRFYSVATDNVGLREQTPGQPDTQTSVLEVDFGDAPAPYPTVLANDGPRHALTSDPIYLGNSSANAPDAEADGQPDLNAKGDDNNGTDDEDGISAIASLVATSDQPTTSSFAVNVTGSGKLDAWIDFNQDGDWLDDGEQIFASIDVIGGLNVLNFTVPAGAVPGDTFARFRLSSDGGLAPTGPAPGGEVEDHVVTILDGDSAGGAPVECDGPAPGEMEIMVEGSAIVTRTGGIDLFRAPGSAIASLDFFGTAGDDTFSLANLDSVFDGPVTGDAQAGSDTLRLTGSGQELDLTQIADTDIQGLEAIDITGSGDNTLTLDSDEVVNISPTTDTLIVRHDQGDTVTYGTGWTVNPPSLFDGEFRHLMQHGTAVLQVVNTTPWQNPFLPLDANRDGTVSPIDALLPINSINAKGPRPLPAPISESTLPEFYLDTNGDNVNSPIDVLLVFNFLNDPRVPPPAKVQSGTEQDDNQTYTGTARPETVWQYDQDSVTLNAGNQENFSVLDKNGSLVYQLGQGGSTVTVVAAETIRVLDGNGNPLQQKVIVEGTAEHDTQTFIGMPQTISVIGPDGEPVWQRTPRQNHALTSFGHAEAAANIANALPALPATQTAARTLLADAVFQELGSDLSNNRIGTLDDGTEPRRLVPELIADLSARELHRQQVVTQEHPARTVELPNFDSLLDELARDISQLWDTLNP